MTNSSPDDQFLHRENMLAGIRAQVEFLKSAPHNIYTLLEANLSSMPTPQHIYLTGCGDSWYCGMATSYAFNRWTGIPTEAPQALEFSRYMVSSIPGNSLLVAVSNSGRVSRTFEAVEQAKNQGVWTLAFTGNLEAGISQVADETIDLSFRERRFAPGTSSYIASLVVQYVLAIFLAGRTGQMSHGEIDQKLNAMSDLSNGMAQTIDKNWESLKQLGGEASRKNNFVFVGAGPNTGSAYFSMAKLIEACGVNALAQETEEWAHIQFFNSHEETYTFLLAPPGASLDRAREIIPAIKHTGSHCIVLCSPEDTNTLRGADIAIPIFGPEDELLSPLVYCLPAELYAYFFSSSKELAIFGFNDKVTQEVNFKTIYESELRKT